MEINITHNKIAFLPRETKAQIVNFECNNAAKSRSRNKSDIANPSLPNRKKKLRENVKKKTTTTTTRNCM